VLLGGLTMFVYNLSIRLLSKFWLITDVPHAPFFFEFFWLKPLHFQLFSSCPAAFQ